ncbi:DUF2753 family protein [Aeromonas salmonicida]|uniref:DUF2753 family protein n=1 Tax=Aeromonas salmonicida TaxID=645 RepID=UPI003AFF1164
MTHHIWQRYMLEAENALGAGALGAAICLYQQALAEVYELASDDLDELGCCQAALISFLKRHPNPEIARLIQLQDKVQGCELIGRFRLN